MTVQAPPTTCAVCGYVGDTPYRTEYADDQVCSYACMALDAARNTDGVEATMHAAVEALDEGCRVSVRAQRQNSHELTGEVIDYSRDGERLTILSDASGRDIELRRGGLRSVEVL